MKKYLLILLFSIPFYVSAQNDTARVKPAEQYCMVIATGRMFSTKVTISVDFGQPTKAFSDKRMKDESGVVLDFNSVIDALNYMAGNGWLFVNAYALSEGSSGKVLNYVMRRPIPKISIN
ncbi:hypothetical protein [Mucilaginibacter sp.]|uniref:hypothetical protein n=1 Tax=Mucilaginibacter sp. TaxID=1882438 RepID=UPI002634FD59|nr:hypothetical protein [Mucilaginibacter sp.]MDB4922810.1 hypothetical protein [Mucilaginibacter sp.]